VYTSTYIRISLYFIHVKKIKSNICHSSKKDRGKHCAEHKVHRAHSARKIRRNSKKQIKLKQNRKIVAVLTALSLYHKVQKKAHLVVIYEVALNSPRNTTSSCSSIAGCIVLTVDGTEFVFSVISISSSDRSTISIVRALFPKIG